MTIRVRNNFSEFQRRLKTQRAPAFVNAILDIVDQQSTFRAPIAYGLLVNSKFRNIRRPPDGVIGTFGYMADYALYLNGDENYAPLWKPKPAPKYGRGNTGRYGPVQSIAPAMGYNPQAKPSFLTSSLDSMEAKSDIQNAKRLFGI